jgi:hypothetical protein
MGTTNQIPINVKQAKKFAEEARKQAEKRGMQPMTYKFSKPKGKK